MGESMTTKMIPPRTSAREEKVPLPRLRKGVGGLIRADRLGPGSQSSAQ